MTTHIFALGQSVRLKGAFQPSGSSYIITALLPPSGDSPQYRIRNEAEKFERMATQANLELVVAPAESDGATLLEKAFGVDHEGARHKNAAPSHAPSDAALEPR